MIQNRAIIATLAFAMGIALHGVSSVYSANPQNDGRPDSGDQSEFTSIFNGVDLTGWQGATEDYEVVDGSITCKPDRGGVLFTTQEYADFTVKLEFKLSAGGNNGLAIRYPGHGRASVDAMCELQILDDDAEMYKDLDPRQYHGAIYGMVAPRRGFLKPVGEWNSQEVTVRGSTIQVILNGTEIVNADVSSVTEFKDGQAHPGKELQHGYFGFAGHNDPVQFRNIQIKRLDRFRLAHFSTDVTIPIGHRCMGVLPQKSTRIEDPLEVHGFVLMGGELPLVFAAVDWCEIRNESYDAWRQALADAAQTTRDRVLVSSLHQHDAPVIDSGAAKLLAEVGLRGELFDEQFHADVLSRVSQSLRDSLTTAQPVTHVGTNQTTVQQIGSSRRVVNLDGTVSFSRGSSSGREEFFRQAPEGLIDSRLRTFSFWNGDICLLELHSYATHPMSYYGRGEVTSDFVGLARRRRQADHPNVKQIYVSGCSGDVTAGKYNDGTPDSRSRLTERLYNAMVASSQHVAKTPIVKAQFRTTPLSLEFSPDPNLTADKLKETLSDPQKTVEQRILAAMGLASRMRVDANQPIDFPCIDFGAAQVVLFPGETFVGYQLLAQKMLPRSLLIPIGYGESWTGYIPTKESFAENFNESWQWVAPSSPERIQSALDVLLGPAMNNPVAHPSAK
jgi:Domain of Unknown Function (DUF1080)